MESFYNYFNPFFVDFFTWAGLSQQNAMKMGEFGEFLMAIFLSILLFFIVNFILRTFVIRAIRNTKNEWDDLLLKHRVLHKASYLAPGFFLRASLRYIMGESDWLIDYPDFLIDIYITVVFTIVINSLLSVSSKVLIASSLLKSVMVKGMTQVLQIIMYVIMSLVIISLLLGEQPGTVLAGLGAASAIILLIFRDAILGFVGGIQLSAYDMVRERDWISLPKHDADGTVIDISLTTVKVQNWDKTISTIPTYALVSESMKNWRGMEESGGRRIKRSVKIDMTSVKFCTPEMLEKFRNIHYLSDYIDKTEDMVKEFNEKEKVDASILVNGRRQTNLGVFRAYLTEYLRNKPEINLDMTFIVRQLDPTERGIPIEIYVFSRIQEWAEYEDIQGDIFDHVLAVIPEFELRVFQEPTGADFAGHRNLDKSSQEINLNPPQSIKSR